MILFWFPQVPTSGFDFSYGMPVIWAFLHARAGKLRPWSLNKQANIENSSSEGGGGDYVNFSPSIISTTQWYILARERPPTGGNISCQCTKKTDFGNLSNIRDIDRAKVMQSTPASTIRLSSLVSWLEKHSPLKGLSHTQNAAYLVEWKVDKNLITQKHLVPFPFLQNGLQIADRIPS